MDASTLKSSRDHHEKELVRLAMEKAEGNVTRAASYLGVSRADPVSIVGPLRVEKTKSDDPKEKDLVFLPASSLHPVQ